MGTCGYLSGALSGLAVSCTEIGCSQAEGEEVGSNLIVSSEGGMTIAAVSSTQRLLYT